MRRKLDAVFVLLLTVFAAGRVLTHRDANVLAAINFSENSLLLTDMGTSRIIRVKDFSATGWEEGPSIAGASLNHPWHLSFDSSGRIYIAEREGNRIVRMEDINGQGFKAFSGIGTNVLANYSPSIPNSSPVSSVAVDSTGRIYIAGSRPLVRIDDMDGSGWSTIGGELGNLGFVNIIFDSQGRFYLSEKGNHQVIRVNDFQGNGRISIGSYGSGVLQFNEPEGLTMDSQGRLYIADESNHRIVRVDNMSGSGWTTFGSYGHGPGQLSVPHDVQVDNLGRIYIADTGNQRIVRINSMAGDGWVDFGRRGCYGGCSGGDVTGAFLLSAPKGIRVLGSGPTLTYSAVFPQIAVGGGYRTSVVGINTKATSVNAEISFAKAAKLPCGSAPQGCAAPFPVTVDQVTATTFTKTVAPMGTIRLDAGAEGNVAAGYALFKSSEELGGVALFQTLSGDTISSEAGVGLSPPTDHFTVYVDNTNNAQTGYAIANPLLIWDGSQAAIDFSGAFFTMTLRDKAGATVETKTLSMQGGTQIAEFASQRFANAGSGFEGTIEFSTGNAQSNARAVALRYDNATQDVFTTVPVILNVPDQNEVTLADPAHKTIPVLETRTLYYPQIADGSTYRTNFILVNPWNAATTATMEFFADNGSPLSLPIGGVARTSLSVPLGAKSAARILTDGTSAGIKVGWARVTQPPVTRWAAIGGSAVFQIVTTGKITSEAGVASSPLASHFTTPVSSLGATQSGIAVCNPNTSNVNLTFRLRDTSGQVVASTVTTLTALGHRAQFFTELFPSFDEFEGTLEVVSTTGPISAVALRYDNPGGTVFATSPVIVLP